MGHVRSMRFGEADKTTWNLNVRKERGTTTDGLKWNEMKFTPVTNFFGQDWNV